MEDIVTNPGFSIIAIEIFLNCGLHLKNARLVCKSWKDLIDNAPELKRPRLQLRLRAFGKAHQNQRFFIRWPSWKNIIKHFIKFRSVQDLEKLTLKLTGLTFLPAKIFMHNSKLRWLSIWDNEKLSDLHSDTLFGLENLTGFSLRKNPINSLPPDFFGNAPNLKTISWEEDKCKTLFVSVCFQWSHLQRW